MRLDQNRRAHDRGISAKGALRGLIAQHRHRRRPWLVVAHGQHTAYLRANAQREKVVAADILAEQRLAHSVAAAHAIGVAPRLYRGQLLKLRRRLLQMQIKVIGIDIEVALVVHVAALDAAVVLVADAIELFGIGDRQRLEQNALHQRKDRGVGPDAQRQRNDRCRCKSGRLAQLPHRIAEILPKPVHNPSSNLSIPSCLSITPCAKPESAPASPRAAPAAALRMSPQSPSPQSR